MMSKLQLIAFLVVTSLSTSAQNSFEGTIKFSTEITTTEHADAELQKRLEYMYGDSLLIYYGRKGNFRRVHLNGGEHGSDAQIYFPETAMLYFTYKNSTKIDSLDAKVNSLKLLSKVKIDNQKIMGLDCECYEYYGIAKFNRYATLNFCYSVESPSINPEYYAKHNDFFLNDYFNTSKRPYLKYSLETKEFKLTYIATALKEEPIEEKVFELKE